MFTNHTVDLWRQNYVSISHMVLMFRGKNSSLFWSQFKMCNPLWWRWNQGSLQKKQSNWGYQVHNIDSNKQILAWDHWGSLVWLKRNFMASSSSKSSSHSTGSCRQAQGDGIGVRARVVSRRVLTTSMWKLLKTYNFRVVIVNANWENFASPFLILLYQSL